MKKVSDSQIETEITASYKPIALESGLTILPLNDLSDREFELLAYSLVKQEIENGEIKGFSSIALMQGVSERGRDCVLYTDGKVTGLIQCKKYQGRLSRPTIIKEIIKFLLFSTLDGSILPDPDNFEYKLYASHDFTEPSVTLIYGYKDELEKEILSGTFDEYISEVVEEYESFSKYIGALPSEEIRKLSRLIKISSSNGVDITRRLYRYDQLLNSFFKVKLVVSLDDADKLLRAAFDDYGVKMLTDYDLKVLQARIGNTSEDNRVNLGYVDFFGYNKEFFKVLKGEKFKEVMSAVANLQTTINGHLIDFTNFEIHRQIVENITAKLLNTGVVHPFSVGIAAPYLFSRLSVRIVKHTMPESIIKDLYPDSKLTKAELIDKISHTLFDASERVMNGDYTHLVGSPEDIEYKLMIYSHIHQGFESIDDAKARLKIDLKTLVPVLEVIEGKIEMLISSEKTIVIKDAAFFDNKDELARMAETIRAIEN